MDLHLHTPASNDYQDPHITYLDILRQAELRGLDIIAFTDHNTVAGYAALQREIDRLLFLERIGRIETDEQRLLEEYRRLLEKILVLPGFEFTATFGFHIIGIFPQETQVSFLEHLLLTLNIPHDQLHVGSSTVGASADVLTAYRVINQAGGIVIAAHANSSNGVMLRGLDFGGQTRIAYTQDQYLHALEVTDLDKRGRHDTRRFFDGSKPEYPRPMRCIQGSDAHRLMRDPDNPKHLGIGNRITEVLLDDVSFESLKLVFESKDLSLTRPFRGKLEPVDYVQSAREEGESIVQAFHTSMSRRGGYFNRVLRDVCAMANTNGGTIYVGVSSDPKVAPVGVRDVQGAIEELQGDIASRFSPEPDITIDMLPSRGQKILRIIVQADSNRPYAIDDNQFYVRDDSETSIAVRDEIVRLVALSLGDEPLDLTPIVPSVAAAAVAPSTPAIEPPRTGVEVVDSEKRKGTFYHSVRDMRNGNVIKNVTAKSARKLWHYAIMQAENSKPKESDINWVGDMALIDTRKRGDYVWYDLALRHEGKIHYYYGVTDSGLNDHWLALVSGKN
jgi:hypothetical protein